jgi:hypothetical protein
MTRTYATWVLRLASIVLLVAAAVYWFYGEPVNGMRVTYFVLLALPWLVTLVLPARNIELGIGLVSGGAIILVPIIAMLAGLAPLVAHSSKADWFLVSALVAAPILALVAVIRNRGVQKTQAVVAIGLLFVAALYEGVVLGAARQFANYVPPSKARLVEAVYVLENCLAQYKQAEGSYPDTFKKLLRRNRCVDPSVLRELEITYSARPKPAIGFNLMVRESSLWTGRWSELSVDEGGVIQETLPGVQPGPLRNPSQLLYEISGCLNRFSQANGTLPSSLKDLWGLNKYRCPDSTLGKDNQFLLNGYQITYEVASSGTSAQMTARPQQYGATGIRSYLLDAEGKLHVTMENRAATSLDDLAPVCEYELYTRCR